METPFDEYPLIGVETPLKSIKNVKWFISEEGSLVLTIAGKAPLWTNDYNP